MNTGSMFHRGTDYLDDPLAGTASVPPDPFINVNPQDVIFLRGIIGLQGTTTGYLSAIATTSLNTPYIVQFNDVNSPTYGPVQTWELQATDLATGSGSQRPNDYNPSTNQKVWVQLG